MPRAFPPYPQANGNGDQLLMVLPELDLVVLFTAGNYGNYGVWRRFREELLPQFIVSAVETKASRTAKPSRSR